MKAKWLTVIMVFGILLLAAAPESYPCGGGGGPPIAILTAHPDTVFLGNSVVLNGGASYDWDGNIIKCEWDWTNNGSYDYYETYGDKKATHTYGSTGTKTAKLRVTDNDYYTDTDICTVTVEPLCEYLPYGMEVNSVSIASGVVTVITTGATYVLSTTGMDMYRRIDPNTNDIDTSNSGKGRWVAELDFSTDIGSLSIEAYDSNRAIIESTKATFDFQSDSFFFITAKSSFRVKHTSLITDAPWNAPLEVNDRDLDRMWTDGYGGSLLAHVSEDTNGLVYAEDVNYTDVNLSTGDQTAHMVFPPKLYDFNDLYGANSRPFVDFTYNKYFMDDLMESGGMDTYINNGFGVFLLWNKIYGDDPNKCAPYPEALDSDPNILGYSVAEPNYIKSFVSAAHANDFKVITYLVNPSNPTWNGQDIAVTLQFMREFQEEYDFDGWFFDNADTGDLIDDYDFMRQVRTDIGDSNIIHHHDSVDVWSMTGGHYYTGRTGLRAIMIDAYVNYIFTGETGTIAEVDSPNDPYLRFYTSGYGMSQAYGNHIMLSSGKTAIVHAEKNRVMGQNLNGFQRVAEYLSNLSWLTTFKPAYDIRKTEYADANTFDPDVDWPLDGNSSDPNLSWFKTPTDVNVTDVNSNSATITWTTNAVSDSNVAYTSNGAWRDSYDGVSPNGPDGTVSDSNMVTSHSITLTGLDSSTPYEFRIRSNNGDANIPGEIIWGYVGDFTTD
jgi:hypothetical protein